MLAMPYALFGCTRVLYAVTPSRMYACAMRRLLALIVRTREMRQDRTRRRGRGKMLLKLLRIKARFVVWDGIRPVPPEAITTI